eukprot:symbB.v1.2.015339.t1/scaffold1094.1/size138377/4
MALSAEQSDKILVDLAQHILENGGVITSEKLGAFYAKHPAHRSLVKNMRSFCEQHPDRIAIEATEGPHYSLKIAVLKEDKVVDLLRTFMQKRNGTATLVDLEGFSTRHPSCGKAIHSGGRSLTQFLLQHRNEFTVEEKSGILMKVSLGSLASSSSLEYLRSRQVAAQLALYLEERAGSMQASVLGQYYAVHPEHKQIINKAPDTSNSVAASLALYLHQMGGSLRGGQLGVYYKSFPRHKDLIVSSDGLKSFCNLYDGLFAFETQQSEGRLRSHLPEGRLCLASFCCHFLRDACNHKKDHQSRRHAKPQSSLVACNFRADCPHGHWRNIVEAATGTLSHVEQCENEEVEMPVSRIRWCHDSIKVVFQDGQLVAMMLKQLLDGDLLLHQIPQIEVLEDDALLYAWTGNRRLWVFKEFERLRKQEVRIKVKKKVTKLPRKNQKFSTTNEGESVTFFSHKRDDSFPSMSFALAAINLVTAPTAWDVKLGDAICRAEGGLPLWKIQSMGDLGAPQNAPSEDLLNYFLSKPYLFVITQGAVDHVVSLTCCLDALKILELNVDPLEIPSLRSLEGEQDRPESGDPDALESQSGEVKALGGYDESSLEEVLRSLCSSGPVSLFSLLDRVGLPSIAETFAELTSFVKQRSHIFHLSNDLFGHTVSLVREPFPDATDDHSEKALEVISETGQEGEMSGTQLGRCSEESASVALSSHALHLYSVLCQHGGSLSLARLEWDEVCVAEFASAVDLENYLCQQPEHFLVWDSDDGKMVSAVSPTNHEPTILKLSEAMNLEEPTVLNLSEVLPAAKASSAEASTGCRWGKAMRQMEEEKMQVLEDHTDLEECMASAGSHQELCPHVAPNVRQQAVQEAGHMVKVTKHSSMGCAVVSFQDIHLRQAILSQGKETTIDNVKVEIKASVQQDIEVLSDIFAEKRYPLSELEIVKYFDTKCREVRRQWTNEKFCGIDSNLGEWLLEGNEEQDHSDKAASELPMVDRDGSIQREDEVAGTFRMLLPSRLNAEISTEVLEILQSSAHRLVFQADVAIKVALRSGWLEQGTLPSMVMSQKDLDELAKRFCWKNAASVQIPGSPHRASFMMSSSRLCRITIHIGRYLPGLFEKAKDLLDASTIFVGPAGSGKTTILRDIAMNLAPRLQVLVVDFLGHLADLHLHHSDLAYVASCGVASQVQRLREAIDDHLPEVIIAEFSDTYEALQAGRVCEEAGVRLLCSVRSKLGFLVEAFVHVYKGPRNARDLACSTFPFASVVVLSRQVEEWEVYPDAPAEVCRMGEARLPRCALHHSAATEATAVP